MHVDGLEKYFLRINIHGAEEDYLYRYPYL